MKNKKLSKLGNLNLGTKIKAFVIACIFLSLIIAGGFAANNVVKMPSGSTAGSVLGKDLICTSNGDTYLPTASNLQTAINSLNSTNGGTVEMGDDITTTVPIYLNDNVTLNLCGHTLFMQAGTNKNLIENYDDSTGNSHITIKNGILNGIDTTLNAGKRGIILVNVSKCKVLDVSLYNVFWGIALFEGTVSAVNERNEIRSCTVDWCNSGIVIDGNNNTVAHCDVHNCTGYAFYARKSNVGHNLWMDIRGYGAQFGSPTGVGLGIVEYESPRQIVIGGSFYGDYPEDCVHISSYGHNSTIIGIKVQNLDSAEDGVYSSGAHVTFSDCEASFCGGRGFYIAGKHSTLNNINSNNNDKEGILFGTSSDYSKCINSEIYDNSQDGAGSYANINIYQPDNISIFNCDIYDTSATDMYGIREAGTTDYNFFANNNLYGSFTSGAMYIIGSNTVTTYNRGYFTVFPIVNVSGTQAGGGWFNNATNVLNIYNGTAWVSTTFT